MVNTENNSTILSVDTTDDKGSVAVFKGNKLLYSNKNLDNNRQAEQLVLYIELALSQAKINYEDLSSLAVVVGPGSFTSIRIGIATIRGIALALNIPIEGISVFELYMLTFLPQLHKSKDSNGLKNTKNIIVILDAARDNLYIQVFSLTGEKIKEAAFIKNSELLSYLAPYKGYVIGNCNHNITSYLQDKIDDFMLENILVENRAVAAGFAAMSDYKKNTYNSAVSPLYIRDVNAVKLPKPSF